MTSRSSLYPVLVFVAVIGGMALPAVRAQQQTPNQPGTTWNERELRDAVDLARVGRKLTPKSWPNGARVAVCLSFDTDTEAPLLRDGTTSPTALSASDFGAESGTPRILKMLDHYQIPATFFITAVDATLHPDMLSAIVKSGRHEVGVHGWIHEFTPRLGEGEEERLLDQAIAYLTKATGQAAGRVPRTVVGIQCGHARSDPEEGFSLRQQPAGAGRAVRDHVPREAHRDRRVGDRLDAHRDALSRPERPNAIADVALSVVQGGVRRRLRRGDDVRVDAASVPELAIARRCSTWISSWPT